MHLQTSTPYIRFAFGECGIKSALFFEDLDCSIESRTLDSPRYLPRVNYDSYVISTLEMEVGLNRKVPPTPKDDDGSCSCQDLVSPRTAKNSSVHLRLCVSHLPCIYSLVFKMW